MFGSIFTRIKKRREPCDRDEITVYSWRQVFSTNVVQRIVEGQDNLAEAVRSGNYSCLGRSHSFNGIQITSGQFCLNLADCKLGPPTYDEATERVTVTASNSIKEVAALLKSFDRMLLNSGNYMEQTMIGALVTGTHGFGERAVMADGIVELTFLDGRGNPHTLSRGDPDFGYVALSFGTIGPITKVVLETAPVRKLRSEVRLGHLSEKEAFAAGAIATSYAVLPYSRCEDPVMLMHTLHEPAPGDPETELVRSPIFSLRYLTEFLLRNYWAFDKLFPFLRRPLHRMIAGLQLRYHRKATIRTDDPDFRYDPQPGLMNEHNPSFVKGMFSTTKTSYNLAFFVPLELTPAVLRFIMNEAEALRHLGFYLKSLIGVRELRGTSPLPFAGNANEPVAAIDLFADVRDYAWLERLEREILTYFPRVRPHWGKSALVEEFRDPDMDRHLDHLRTLHQRHYGESDLKLNEHVRRLLGMPKAAKGSSIEKAYRDSDMAMENGIGVTG